MAPPNVLLVVLDSVRARNTSLHGHVNDTTPFLDSFSDSSTKYEFAYSPGIHSTPSHTSIFTGLHVDEHMATGRSSMIDTSATIWEELSEEHDYATGLFTANVPVAEASNLGEAFDHVEGPREWDYTPFPDALAPSSVEDINSTSYLEYLKLCITRGYPVRGVVNGIAELLGKEYNWRFVDEGCEYYLDQFLSWADERHGSWAACVNLMDAHFPYRPDPEYDRWGGEQLQDLHRRTLGPYSKTFFTGEKWWKLAAFEALYDGGIYQIDQHLERLVSRLEERGVLDDTLLVVTSDHGEGFGERSEIEPGVRLVDHSWAIDEELIHVPLLVRRPGQQSGEIIERPASLSQFPSVVRSAIDGSPTQDGFVPDGPVLSSTYSPIRRLPDACDNPEDYQGPWKAVVVPEDDAVVKYAVRQSREATFQIHDAQGLTKRSNGGGETLRELFTDGVDESVDIGLGDRNVSADVQQRLEDLGYA